MPGAKQNQQKRQESQDKTPMGRAQMGPAMKSEGYVVCGEDIRRVWKSATSERQKSEIALTWYAAGKSMMWASKSSMGEQAVLWRDMVRKGEVNIREANNKQKVDSNGRTWNMLVVQPTNPDHAPPCDVVALLEFGFAVSGYVYFFKSVENRDSIYRFVMGV